MNTIPYTETIMSYTLQGTRTLRQEDRAVCDLHGLSPQLSAEHTLSDSERGDQKLKSGAEFSTTARCLEHLAFIVY
jgi:hypothetical protein